MVKALIIVAHPEQQSYNHHLARFAKDILEQQGAEVRLTDLAAIALDPVEHPRHYRKRRKADRFDVQSEQRWAHEDGATPPDVTRQIEDLMWADLVIAQFPLWWFGLPAILKGWIDRVFIYGGMYSGGRRHDTGHCRGKRFLASTTAGASARACAYNGQEGETELILWPSLYAFRYVGFDVLRPFIMHGIRGGVGPDELADYQAMIAGYERDYARVLRSLDERPLVPYNPDEDYDTLRQLRPGAPVHSPFIRHERDPRWDCSNQVK
ncbi:NAD(P)H-dependent oxidoreductase [Taklimakanibacter deserti]|uniref:NAD(P)H-dependent oxidoreductase n=1 Tax=Taklimakanibacter deserti TaxID=2267839 RepID=UPI000E64FCE7